MLSYWTIRLQTGHTDISFFNDSHRNAMRWFFILLEREGKFDHVDAIGSYIMIIKVLFGMDGALSL